jgi:putative phage-type endonuclease
MFNFSEEDIIDLEIEIHSSVDKYLSENGIQQCQPEFYKTMVDKITQDYLDDLITIGFIEEDRPYEKIFKKFRKMIHIFIKNYFTIIGIPRRCYQNPRPLIYEVVDKSKVKMQIEKLQNLTQMVQRTNEWYQFRHNLITASNIWKAIGSEANQNSLILEKCKPMGSELSYESVNTDSPLHWGVKYEPLTVMLYEQRNRCKVGEFGCIQHPAHSFIGASPDGIVVSEDSSAYGRMLEIKNVVSREITGIPKMDYWVQMQVQMEVADLDECDFVETRIKEYASKTEFLESANPYKGVVITFVPRITIESTMRKQASDKKQFYEYFLLSDNAISVDDWVQSKKLENPDYVLSNTVYWGLDQYSCVLVKRNRAWFDAAIPHMEKIWKTVERERITGCEHRMPKKREPKMVALTVNKVMEQDAANNTDNQI